MPIKPKIRPIGQPVKLVTEQEFEGKVFPVGTRSVVEDYRIESNYKVSYKIILVNKMGSRIGYWVMAADIKARK